MGARQTWSAGPRFSSSAPSYRQDPITPSSLSKTRLKSGPRTTTSPAGSSTSSFGISAIAEVGTGGTSKGTLNWAQASSWPTSAQAVARARVKLTVSQYSTPGLSSGGLKGTVTASSAPGGVSRRGKVPAWSTWPSADSFQETSSPLRSEKWYRLTTLTFPASRSTGSTWTGSRTFLYSHSAGWTRRSGKTRPLMQKLPSFGSSPKSPP